MSPRYDAKWVASMLNAEERLGSHKPEELLARSGLGEKQTVLDLGCGPGLFAIPAATIVRSSGCVYAVDTEQTMLDLIENRAESLGLNNISTVLSTGETVPLPGKTIDYVICGLILHDPPEYEGRVNMARDVGRLVRPNGRILVIERSPESGEDHGHRLAPDETKAILREAGFDAGEPETLVDNNYMMVATPMA